jgi:hypothetical protein
VEFPPVFPAQILFLVFLEFRGLVPEMPVALSLTHGVPSCFFLFWGPVDDRGLIRLSLWNQTKQKVCQGVNCYQFALKSEGCGKFFDSGVEKFSVFFYSKCNISGYKYRKIFNPVSEYVIQYLYSKE